MKSQSRNKKGMTAAAIIAGLSCATAMFATRCNYNASVYGPPPEDPTSASYSASNNQNEDVYGPPEDFEKDTAEEADADN